MTPSTARALLAEATRTLPPRPGAVRLDLDDAVAILTLDNPAARNAVTGTMMLELDAAVDRLMEWPGAALILTGTPCGAFCSGGHLGDVRAGLTQPDVGRAMTVLMTHTLDRLLAAPFVSVCAIDGVAVGGGAELATATDFRVATTGSRIHFVHAKLGVAPGWGGAHRLKHHLGGRAALRLLSTARSVSDGEALELGLFDAVADGSALDVARSFLAPTLALPVASVRAVKQQLLGTREEEAAHFLALWGGPAHRNALEQGR